MHKKNIFLLTGVVLLTLVVIFFTRAYKELIQYSDLTGRVKIVNGSFQNLARQINHAAVLTPELQKASKLLKVATLFYTDSQSVMNEIALLKATVRDSVNIKIVQQLELRVSAELLWLLKSDVPDSIIQGNSSAHLASIAIIDSLISSGIERTNVISEFRSDKLQEANNKARVWMTIFVVLSGIIFVYTTITQRKNAKNIQDKNEKRFKALVENYDAIISVLDENLVPIYRTAAAERLTGYSETDRKEKSGRNEVHAEDSEALTKCLIEVRANPGKVISLTFRLKHKQGHYIWLDAAFTNLLHDPSVQGIVMNVRDISERKKAEDEIIKVYKEKETVLNRISDSVVSVDNEWRYTFLNEPALATHPLAREETLGKVIWDVHPEMEGTIFWDKYHEAMQTKKMVEIEDYYAPMDIWFSVKVYPSEDGLTILYRDDTAHKKAQDKVKESELFYRSLIEQASDAIFIADQRGEYIDVNTSACKLLGYGRQELLTMSAKDIVSSEAKAKLVPDRFEGLRAGTSDIEEFKLKRKDGTLVAVESNAKMLSDGRFVGIVRDITERKTAELKLAQTLLELTDYKFALDEAGIVSITDQKGIINHVNHNFCQVSKYSRKELIGKDHRIINSGYHSKDFIKSMWDTIASGKVWRGEIKNNTKDGGYFWVDTTIVPFHNDVGDHYQYIAIRSDITERKNADLKLIENEKRFRVLIENMSDAIVLNDEQSNLIYQSPSVTRILGYTWEERRGHKVAEYIHPDNLSDFTALYKSMNENPGQPFPFQFRFLHKEGHYVWLEGVINDLLHEPSIKAIVANYRDVSDRKEGEEKLLRERTLLRTLIDNIPDYIYVKDTNFHYCVNNRANVKLMGKTSEEETIGLSAVEMFGADIAQRYQDDDQMVINSGEPVVDREETIISSSGELKFLLTTKVALKGYDQNILGLIGISRDITIQKAAELELRNANYFLEMAQQVGKIGHWISDLGESTNLTWSAETCRIFGLQPDCFDGRLETFFGFMHAEDVAEVNGAVAIAIKEKHAYSIDHRIVLPDGTVKWVHEQGEPTFDEQGQAIRLVGIVQDITQRKETESEILKLNEELEGRVKIRTEQLQAANKEMEAFTYSVSHDLRSPLRIIDGYAQILIEDHVTTLDDEGQKTLAIIVSNAKKMGQLIDDLLNFSHIGRIEIRRNDANMNRLVDEVIHDLDLSGIKIPERLLVSPLTPARCDPNLIKHVWMNLLSNAIKYSSNKTDPEIEVGMLTVNGKVAYYVKDNGVGFDMNYYHKLFGVFQRLHGYEEFSGTGVGLAIVQRIIVRHGGTVWAESKLSEGTTFFFTVD